MDLETLKKANELKNKIDLLSGILNCFFWEEFDYEKEVFTGEIDFTSSKNPKIIIEFDDVDGREEYKLPMELSSEFIDYILRETTKELNNCKEELEKL